MAEVNNNGKYRLTTEHRMTKMEEKIESILENHLPSIQKKIEKVDAKLWWLIGLVITTLIAVIVRMLI